jgi:hypothetical protein
MTHHFFDTNLLLLPPDKRPLVLDEIEEEAWVTEVTREELVEIRGADEAKRLLAPFRVLDFHTLYGLDPGACPVYFTYLQGMFNPAPLGREDLPEEFMLAKTRRGHVITSAERAAYDELMRRASSSRSTLADGTEKDARLRKIERFDAKSRKKIRRAARDNHKNQLNDSRSMALMIYYALKTKSDVSLYTADADALNLMLKWLDSAALRMTLTTKIGASLTFPDWERLHRGESVSRAFNFKQLISERSNNFNFLTAGRDPSIRFALKLWDQEERCLDEEEGFRLSIEHAELLSQMHGSYFCHFSPNQKHWNWFKYRWRLGSEDESLNIEVLLKNPVTSQLRVPAKDHDLFCQYRREEAARNSSFFSDFTLIDDMPAAGPREQS